jgi:hypothetical protein
MAPTRGCGNAKTSRHAQRFHRFARAVRKRGAPDGWVAERFKAAVLKTAVG